MDVAESPIGRVPPRYVSYNNNNNIIREHGRSYVNKDGQGRGHAPKLLPSALTEATPYENAATPYENAFTVTALWFFNQGTKQGCGSNTPST